MSDIVVIKRDGSIEDFEVSKVSASIMGAAMAVGGENVDLADELADNVLDMLESNEISKIEASDIQQIVEKILIEEGHAATAKEYILRSADRNRIREMDTALMKSFEEITFKSEADSEVKRENANIDSSTAMGTMLKYGSEAAKNFNTLYMMSEESAHAHKDGDIHIHDLDFFALTETCITADTTLVVKEGDLEYITTASKLFEKLGVDDVDNWHNVDNLKVLSNGKFVSIKAAVKHTGSDKRVLNIKTATGELNVTDNHKIGILVDGKYTDVEAKDVKVGDVLSVPEINKDTFGLGKIDIIDMYEGDNLIIHNTADVIADIKERGFWKMFCTEFDYRESRSRLIRDGKANLTISEYKRIEHLTNITHDDTKIAYKRTRGNETINAVLPLTFELGNIIGLMYAEGSITEHIDSRNDTPVYKACFCNYDENLIEQFNTNYSKVFNNAELKVRQHNGKHTGTRLTAYLQYELFHGIFGYKHSTDNIRLANWMFTANSRFVDGLISGIIDGDGCVQKDGYRVTIASISKKFLEDIQKLLLLRGVDSSIKSKTGAEKGSEAYFPETDTTSIRSYDNYVLEFTGNLSQKLGWLNSNKIREIGLASSNKFPNKNTEIKSITEIEYTDYVYDIETEDNHFTANGFNVHNCAQIPLDKLFEQGFNTGHGFLRAPGGIRTASALAAIAIQSNQNDQHGGQSIPLFDYYLAPYVALTYVKNIAHVMKTKFDLEEKEYRQAKNALVALQIEKKLVMNDEGYAKVESIIRDVLSDNGIEFTDNQIKSTMKHAYNDTYDETFQAMEAFIHNLNTMHCLPASEKIWAYNVETCKFYTITMEKLDAEFKPNKFKVVSLNKETGKAEFKFITACQKKDNNRRLIKLTDNQGRTVTVTDNHKVMTVDGTAITEKIPEECDYTLSPKGIRLPATKYDLCVSDYGTIDDGNKDHLLVDERLAKAFGYIISCGELDVENNTLTFKVYDDTLIDSVVTVLEPKVIKVENGITVKLSDAMSKMLADKVGCNNKTFTIPNELLLSDADTQNAFIDALSRFSISELLNENTDIHNGLELMKVSSKYYKADNIISDNVYCNEIVSKTEANSGDEYVYDISVEDNENFLTAECIYVHNSRAGAQVPFSSINYGTDTSTEGRMIMETLLNTTWQGLGNGETPIFPIQIYKLKEGVTFGDGAPNDDLFQLACKVSAKRLYPNFVNLDAPYNAELYVEGRPETEMATMGCRTRVGTNKYDPDKQVIPGRGNLSFTSINLPRLAIKASGDIKKFYKMLDSKLELVHKQLLERFEIQCQKHPLNYPFLMGQGIWLGSDLLGPNDDIRDILKHGTLGVGFIGLAETLTALTGKHHGESEEAQKLGLEIIQHMRDYCDAWSEHEHMNYGVIGTPAEGLSGRFVRMDRALYGVIPGVTDKEYYTNSSHVPVGFKISATKKVDIEAPYHEIENGGHILYIEMDGDPTKNLKAFTKVVKYMHDKNAGYFAINHPVDRDEVCGYVGIIDDVCPRCGRREGEPMTIEMWNKLKGYALSGNADTLGACGNPNEEADRITNDLDME